MNENLSASPKLCKIAFSHFFDRIVQSEGGMKIIFCKGTFIFILIFRKIGFAHPKDQKIKKFWP